MAESADDQRLPTSVVAVLVGATSLMIGYGLAFSYTALYLRQQAGGSAVVAYFAALGASGIIVGLVLSHDKVRVPDRAAVAVALLLGSAVFASLGQATGTGVAAFLGAVLGSATALYQSCLVPILYRITPAGRRRGVFALRYQGANVALAVGVALTGLVVSRHGVAGSSAIFGASALLHLPLLLCLCVVPGASRSPVEAVGHVQAQRQGPIWRIAGTYLLFQLFAGLFVFAHLESTVPLVVVQGLGAPALWATAFVLSNLAAVLFLQAPVTRLLVRWSPETGLILASAGWVLALLAALSLVRPNSGHSLAGLVALGAIVGLGECAYACSFQPALLAAVDEQSVQQATSLANVMSSLGTLGGPFLGVFVLGHSGVTAVWLLLLGGAVATFGLTAWGCRPRRASAPDAGGARLLRQDQL